MRVLLILLLLGILISLGCWQLRRADIKAEILAQYKNRQQIIITPAQLAHSKSELKFYQITLSGNFDHLHNILLDNKINSEHQAGYRLYTPFYLLDNPHTAILVERGFIPQGTSRHKAPIIQPILGQQTLKGILAPLPAAGFILGADEKFNHQQWPMRTSKINLDMLKQLLQHDFYSYILIPGTAEISMAHLKPERHIGYAVQWFAMAGVLLLFCLIVSIRRYRKKS